MTSKFYIDNNAVSGGLIPDMIPVTPNDGTDLAPGSRNVVGLYIESGGVLVVRTIDSGTTSRSITVASFQTLPLAVTRVLSTGTTATGIHALVQ